MFKLYSIILKTGDTLDLNRTLKRDSNTGFFLWIFCENFKNTLFTKHLQVTAFKFEAYKKSWTL